MYEDVKKVRLFGLGYVRVNVVWEKFMRVCEWSDNCERIIFFKV